MEAEFLFKSQFDKSLKILLGGILVAISVQPIFLATVPKALLPPEPWVYQVPKNVVSKFKYTPRILSSMYYVPSRTSNLILARFDTILWVPT